MRSCDAVVAADRLQAARAGLREQFGARYDAALEPCMAALKDRMERTRETPLLAAMRVAMLPGMNRLMSRMYLAAGLEMVCR